MKTVIVFDADNTLWDTNAVFRDAQLALLGELAKAKLITLPDSQLDTLRIVDQGLVSKLGYAEYDFRLLAVALVLFYSQKMTIEDAVQAALVYSPQTINLNMVKIIDKAFQAFKAGMKGIPDFYPDTLSVLSTLRAFSIEENSLAMIMFTEGSNLRLEQILEFHDIRGQKLFDEIVIAPKSKESFEKVKQVGVHLLHTNKKAEEDTFILVGDSLHRDIKLGNQTGFVTIYKPSAFKGVEIPNALDEQPDYVIKSLKELFPILKEILSWSVETLT